MRVVTWNINSVRLRARLVRRLVDEMAPDVLCLQETKVADELFPHDALTDLFEGLWPVAREGVSYNAYFIRDERQAIIDLSRSM